MATTPATGPADRDEGSASRPRPWYRRRAFVVTAAIVVVLAVTVVTDLPTHNSHASDVVAAQQVMSEIAGDAAPCNLGMEESLGFYHDVTSGDITAAHRAQIPGLIHDDLEACSFTNQDMVDLGGIDVPGNVTGRALNHVALDVLTWCDPAALAAIGEITALIESRPTPAGRARLAADEALLTKDRDATYRAMSSLARLIATTDFKHVTLVSASSPQG
jgi:hypothetical protein